MRLYDDEQFQVRVAWLYHVEGVTQGEIAEKLNVTRLNVNRALQDALKKGIVKVNIHSHYSPCFELEKQLKKAFSLQYVSVVPSPLKDENALKVVGSETGHYLSSLLARPSIKLFGISWGETLKFATRAVTPTKRKDLEIVSVMGGLPEGSDFNIFSVVSQLAKSFSADRTYLTLPLFSSSAESRNIIFVQEVFQETFEKIRKADGIAISAGDMSKRSLLINYSLPSDVTRKTLIEAGAVGDILGYFLDENGKIIDHPIAERVLGLNPFEFQGKPNLILAAGGKYKQKIILAALRTGIFDTLITDQSAAECVIERS